MLRATCQRALRNYLARAGDNLNADLTADAAVALPGLSLSLHRLTDLQWAPDGASVLASLEASDGDGVELRAALRARRPPRRPALGDRRHPNRPHDLKGIPWHPHAPARSPGSRSSPCSPSPWPVRSPCSRVEARGDVAVAAVRDQSTTDQQTSAPRGANALQDAAERAGQIGRVVALSMIGLALAAASVMLIFRRDFKEAAGIFAVGLLAVLLATPSGLNLLRNTAALIFGGQ